MLKCLWCEKSTPNQIVAIEATRCIWQNLANSGGFTPITHQPKLYFGFLNRYVTLEEQRDLPIRQVPYRPSARIDFDTEQINIIILFYHLKYCRIPRAVVKFVSAQLIR
ncbi:hypothetical protein DF034_33185 [Burkholderia anthina]|nr:hypothetical protein DF034_33185 [Burkholderia anthina]